jgi:hypothetical protein
MSLTDLASEHPLSLFAAIVVWIPVGIWVLSLLQWMIQGDMDFLTGMAGSVFGIALGVLTTKPPEPWMSPMFLLAVLAVMLIYPGIRAAIEARAHVAIDVEMLEKAYDSLAEKPGNFGARWKMAQVLFTRGLHGHAIAIAEDLLGGADQSVFYEEIKIVARWKDQSKHVIPRPLPCLECGTLNAPGELYCSECHSKFLLDYAKGKWLGYRSLRRLIAVWIAGVSGLVGIPTALASLTPQQCFVVIPLLMLVSILIIWRAYMGQNEADTA